MKAPLHKLILVLAAFGVAAGGPAAASEARGKVSKVYVTRWGVALFHIDAPARTGVPACGAGLPTRWAFNAKTPEGQAMLSFILTAFASGKELEVYGQNACPDWGDTESVDWTATI